MSRRVAVASVVLALVTLLAGIAVVSAIRYRQEDVFAECARVFEDQKAELLGYHWSWLPPAWTCEYEKEQVADERRLPVIRR